MKMFIKPWVQLMCNEYGIDPESLYITVRTEQNLSKKKPVVITIAGVIKTKGATDGRSKRTGKKRTVCGSKKRA